MNGCSLLLIAFTTALLPAQGPPGAGTPDRRQKPPQPMLIPQAAVVPRGERDIKIDGSLVDWPQLPAISLSDRRQLSGTGNGAWRGPKDASGMLFMMWDEQSLYVACAVRDEWHRSLDPKTLRLTEIPAADSVVLTFDPERNTRAAGNDPGRREDREFWLADEVGRQVVQWDRLRGGARVLEAPARMVALHDKEQGITMHEARIPWSEILPRTIKPEAGLCLDLQIVINDFDESTDSMPQTRIGWTFGCGPVVDPGLLGSIMLVADTAVMRGEMPTFPPKPGTKAPPAKPAEYWHDLTAQLLKHEPAVYDGSKTPAEVGGIERLKVLEEIEQHCARMPRVDFLELQQRIHRRMNREVAGLMARGLPSWWRRRLFAIAKQGEDDVPKGAARIFRLPMGGWLVRSTNNLLIDPVGSDVAKWMWGGAEMCVLTQPLDMTRRNDQLLVRMYMVEPQRPVYSHIVFHLPIVGMDKITLAVPGQTYGIPGATQVVALGQPEVDGSVRYDCGYRVELLDGPNVVIVSPTMTADDIAAGEAVHVLIASPRNPDLLAIVAKAKPDVVLIDDAFICQTHPTKPRVTLRDVHTLQRALLPHKSVVLAPGESWLVQPK